ncbi:MAG: TMEM165/GDT1 family protein [Gammaproteobacteria bacterium]|nr:TMEM165/GDT1 family protein [Gammaproteobacteria bacterium]
MSALDILSVASSAFALVGLAEIGDKSQLVCISLAARHRHWPVLLGASAAFLLLNALAVLFGAGVAVWLPERAVAGLVALLFAVFGIQALRASAEAEVVEPVAASGRGIFATTFALVFVAEFGDKTQLAVAGLAGGFDPLGVWLGASAALVTLSALGVWAGCTLFQRLPLTWLHRAGGGLFLAFALLAAGRALGWSVSP